MTYWEPPYPIMSDDMIEDDVIDDPDDWHDQRQFERACEEQGL